MAANKGDSRERLLDAAEFLFAQKGFDGTSTREIALRSGDTIGTLGHHFGSKDNLLREVLARRFSALDELRQKNYSAAVREAGGKTPDLEATIAAIALPFIDRAIRGDRAWRSYTLLAGMVVRANDAGHREFYSDLRASYTAEYKHWLKLTAPDALDSEIRYAYDMIVNTIIGTCSDFEYNRIKIGDNIDNIRDGQKYYDYIVPRVMTFLLAGVKELLS